jgi:hypothetical protein
MRWVAVVAALLVVDPADAGEHCGASSGSESSSSSSDSSSSSSSDSSGYESGDTSTAHTACIDDTDIVGFRHCRKYGTWARSTRFPRLFFELGSNVRQFSTGLAARTSTVAHGSERFAFKTVMAPSEVGRDTAVTSALRVGVGIGRRAYVGTELELGALVSPAAAHAEMMTSGSLGTPSIAQERGSALGALGLGGYRAHAGRATFAVEAAAGVRSARYHYTSTYHDCVDTTTITKTTGVIEARARVETWLGPWMTAGATVGSSLISRGDWMGGAYLGFHTRAFGGGR